MIKAISFSKLEERTPPGVLSRLCSFMLFWLLLLQSEASTVAPARIQILGYTLVQVVSVRMGLETRNLSYSVVKLVPDLTGKVKAVTRPSGSYHKSSHRPNGHPN